MLSEERRFAPCLKGGLRYAVTRQARVGHGLDPSMDWIGMDLNGLDSVSRL